MYELRFMRPAERYFKKIKDKGLKAVYREALEQITLNPYIGEQKMGDLTGMRCLDVYYNKTNYEVAYRIYEDKGQIVVVILAGTRENFYKELKRYMNS